MSLPGHVPPLQDTSLLPAVHQRVRLAVRLDELERRQSKSRAEKSWRRQHAEELGIELSDDSEGAAPWGIVRVKGNGLQPPQLCAPCTSCHRQGRLQRLSKYMGSVAVVASRPPFPQPRACPRPYPAPADEEAVEGRRLGKKAQRERGGKRGPEDAGEGRAACSLQRR